MKKKSFNWLSYLPVITLALGGIVGFVKFQAKAEETAKKVEKVEGKVDDLEKEGSKELEQVKKENQEVEKSITEMRVQQIYLQKSVDSINDNIKDLIQEIKDVDKKEKKK